MRGGLDSDEEWQSWQAIDSTFTPEAVAEFERPLPAALPQFFRAYILGCHTLGMDFGEYHLPSSPSDKTLKQNFYTLRDPTFWAARGCGDPLVFDFPAPTADGDYPVAVFNHDVVPHEILENREALKPYEAVVAPSFREFFELVLANDDSTKPDLRNTSHENTFQRDCLKHHAASRRFVAVD